MVILVVFVLVTGIAFDSWLEKKATLIIQKKGRSSGSPWTWHY